MTISTPNRPPCIISTVLQVTVHYRARVIELSRADVPLTISGIYVFTTSRRRALQLPHNTAAKLSDAAGNINIELYSGSWESLFFFLSVGSPRSWVSFFRRRSHF